MFLIPKVGFRFGQCTTEQIFKLTHDVEHRFEENKLGIVLANVTAAQNCLLYGTIAKHPTIAFDLVLLLCTTFYEQAKNKKCAFFHKITGIEHKKLILCLILMISVDYEKLKVFFSICWYS